MKHKNDLKIKIDKEPRKKENILKRGSIRSNKDRTSFLS